MKNNEWQEMISKGKSLITEGVDEEDPTYGVLAIQVRQHLENADSTLHKMLAYVDGFRGKNPIATKAAKAATVVKNTHLKSAIAQMDKRFKEFKGYK